MTEPLTITPEKDYQGPAFAAKMRQAGNPTLRRSSVATLQINVGKRCNQACHHCHVDAGPKRTEQMTQKTAERVMTLLAQAPEIETVDITGGAPELNPHFRYLVETARGLGKHVIDRCNLTILLEDDQEDLGEFLKSQQVEIIASLPCYSQDNVDKQRGSGVFDKSIVALKKLNTLGFGIPGSDLLLNLVYNPGGAFLPPAQDALEKDYKAQLAAHFGIEFTGLYTLANLPINRFKDWLKRNEGYQSYMDLLIDNFNGATLDSVMCRSQISVDWQGNCYDCDFNQMLELPVVGAEFALPPTIWNLDAFDTLINQPIATGGHCYGCTAGSGSSCGGALK